MPPGSEDDKPAKTDESDAIVSAGRDIRDAVITQGTKVRVDVKIDRRQAANTAAKGCIVVIVQQVAPVVLVAAAAGYFIYHSGGKGGSTSLPSLRNTAEDKAVADFVKEVNATGSMGAFSGPGPDHRITDYRLLKEDHLVERPSNLSSLLTDEQRIASEIAQVENPVRGT